MSRSPWFFGGGISNYGTLTITNSTINSNLCYLAGGSIYNGGRLTITGSTVSGNGATGQHDGKPFGPRRRDLRRGDVH
jgi:hypothetical protein